MSEPDWVIVNMRMIVSGFYWLYQNTANAHLLQDSLLAWILAPNSTLILAYSFCELQVRGTVIGLPGDLNWGPSSSIECYTQWKKRQFCIIPLDNSRCSFSKAYQDYFWKSCMPGANGNLCKVCIGPKEVEGGKGLARCAANHNERYYGNMGALRWADYLERKD